MAAPGPGAPTPTPPTSGITPIKNGKLMSPLDANNFQIQNLDVSNLPSGGGGGGGGSGLASITGDDGSATGLTLGISHVTGSNLTDPVFTLGATLSAAHGGTGVTSLSLLKSGLSLNNVDNTTDLTKPISTATQTALDLKLNITTLAAFAGTSNITTLGTIATGIWNGTALGAAYVPALNALTAPTGDLSLNSHKITSLADPAGATDATNKQYVDAVAVGGVPHSAAATASTNNRLLTGEQTIDGVLTSASRVLLKNQTTASENGIYVTAAGAWARATDADTGAEISGSVFVSGGTVNAGTTWAVTTPQPITIDSTSVAYTQTGANTIYSATSGITLTGSQFGLTPMATGTLKGNNAGTTQVPTDLTYATVKTAMSLNAVENTALSTWPGTANITTLGTIATGVIPPARIQGITAVGSSLLTALAPTGSNYFIRINATSGTATPRLGSELLSDISGQTAITVTTPLALTLGGALTIQAATDSLPGYMTAADHTSLSGKVPGTRTIQATAPLRIAGVSGAPIDLSANRTIDAVPVSTTVDGYLTTADYVRFRDTAQAGTNSGPTAWLGTNQGFIETTALTADRVRTLPPTASYADGALIKYLDPVTTGLFGPLFLPAGTDTLKGSLSAAWTGIAPFGYRPFLAAGYGNQSKSVTFQKRGIDWRVYAIAGETLTTTGIQNPTNLGGLAQFNANTVDNLRVVSVPNADSTFVIPTDSGTSGFVRDIAAGGDVSKVDPRPTDLVPQEDIIGTAGNPLPAGTFPATDDGTKDTIRIAGTLQGPLQINWPHSANYNSGKTITLLDASGSASASNPITLTNGSDTFSGQSSVVFNEGGMRKVLTSDGGGNWSVSAANSTLQPFNIIPGSPAGTFTIVSDASAGKQNAQIQLVNGANNLLISNPKDGMPYEIVLLQPVSGAAGTLNLPIGSNTSPGGGGLITLTATNGAIDRLKGSYDGNINAFLWDAPILNHTSAATPTAPSVLTATSINANKVNLAWTDNASTETGFTVERAPGLAATTGFVQLASLAANVVAYSDTTVIGATAYTWRVRAFNTGGYSAYSNTPDLTTSAGGPTADLLEWHFNENTGVNVGHTIGPDGTLALANWTTSTQSSSGAAFAPVVGMLSTVGAVSTVGTPSSGTPPIIYTYKVAAWKTATNTHNSNSPINTAATAPATLTTGNYNHITWSAVSGADYYEVYRSAVSGGSPTAVGRIGSNVTALFFDDTGMVTNGSIPGTITTTTDSSIATAKSNVTYSNVVSVSFWAKSTFGGGSVTTPVINLNSTTAIRAVSPSKLFVTFNGATGTLAGTVAIATVADNAWHHIVVEMDNSTAGNTTSNGSSDNIRVYFDGSATQRTVSYSPPTRSGAANFAPSAPVVGSATLAGSIDDVRIYNRLLNTTEIAALFSGNAQ